MTDQSRQTLKSLPNKPGVYRYYALDDSLLYVGKAKNLKNRVRSYFQNSKDKNQRIALMVEQIHRIDYTITSSEAESLVLEANLIHSLQPKYNISLKEDKSYCYIKLSADEIPGLFITRQKYDSRATYFGPYSSRPTVEATLRTLRYIFPFCQVKKPQKSPCSYVGLNQCEGICCNQESMTSYTEKLEQIKTVLLGKIEPAVEFLTQKIHQAASQQNYALANLWKRRLELFQKTIGTKEIILPEPQDIDLICLVTDRDQAGLQFGSIFVQQIREGKMVNVNNFLLSGSEVLDPEDDQLDQQLLAEKFLSRFLVSYYSYQNNSVPVLVQSFSPKKEFA